MVIDQDLVWAKKRLRKHMRDRLSAFSRASERADLEVSLQSNLKHLLTDLGPSLNCVASFFPMLEEPQIPVDLFSVTKNCVFPRITKDSELEFCSVSQGFQRGPFGLLEPGLKNEPVDFNMIDLFCVPALAFDRRGCRLGRGKAYYDRALVRSPKAIKVGVAWSFQIVPEVPTGAHDVFMDYVLTDNEVVNVSTANRDSNRR